MFVHECLEAGFPEEGDPWIFKFRIEISIPEEYDPVTVLLKNTILYMHMNYAHHCT